MERRTDLIQGAYDLHIHTAPDVLPRKVTDLELARRYKEAGMAGFVAKSHYFCSSERARVVNDLVPEAHVYGAMSLNCSVGGINPVAVEMAGREDTKVIWFPTSDAKNEQDRMGKESAPSGKPLPYWARVAKELKEKGVEVEPVYILDENGKLKKEAHDVLDIIAGYGMILATGHLTHEEAFALVKSAKEDHHVEHIVITHVDFPTTFYTDEEQKEFARYGAFMEHCYVTWETGKVDYEEALRQIKVMGPERVLISTDLGQTAGIFPDEGMAIFATKLSEAGFTDDEVRMMVSKNAQQLLGLS